MRRCSNTCGRCDRWRRRLCGCKTCGEFERIALIGSRYFSCSNDFIWLVVLRIADGSTPVPARVRLSFTVRLIFIWYDLLLWILRMSFAHIINVFSKKDMYLFWFRKILLSFFVPVYMCLFYVCVCVFVWTQKCFSIFSLICRSRILLAFWSWITHFPHSPK